MTGKILGFVAVLLSQFIRSVAASMQAANSRMNSERTELMRDEAMSTSTTSWMMTTDALAVAAVTIAELLMGVRLASGSARPRDYWLPPAQLS